MTDAARWNSAWSWAGVRRAITIAGVALGTGGALGYLVAHEPPPRSPTPQQSDGVSHTPAPLSDEERRVLAPLAVGAPLGDFVVTELRPIPQEGGTLGVRCARGTAVVRLEITLARATDPTPPATVGPYAVYYSVERARAEDGDAIAKAIASILLANSGAPVPRGLGAFGATRR